MAFRVEDINDEIEKNLRSLAKQKGDEFATAIRSIVYTNLERDRLQAFIGENINHVQEYVERLAKKYCELGPLIKEIQIERTEKVWGPLLIQMQVWSYNFFIRKGFYANANTQEIAEDCANEAGLALLSSHFPYDIDFEPWVHVIVQNVCRRYIRNSSRKKDIPEQKKIELDTILEEVVDTQYQDLEQHNDEQDDVFGAIALLSDSRRQAIELLYFEELSPREVAKIMGKSVGAIYSLQFNALEDLRKILGKKRNNSNE